MSRPAFAAVSFLSAPFAVFSALTLSLCAAPPLRAQTPENAPPPSLVFVRAVAVRGTKALKETLVQETAEKAAAGKPTPDAARRAAVEAVRALYKKRGYTMAQITDAEIADDGTLTLQIAEGVIRNIVIRGNRKTKDRTIRHALSIRPGDIYQESRVNDERKRLARLGIFTDITIAPRVPGTIEETADSRQQTAGEGTGNGEQGTGSDDAPSPHHPITPSPAPPTTDHSHTGAVRPLTTESPDDVAEIGSVDLVVSVKDGDTASVQASLGYSDGVGAVGFVDLSEANLFGTGQQAQILWQRTVQVNFRADGTIESRNARAAFAFGYASPALNRNDVAFGAQVYDSNTVLLPLFGSVRETLRTYEKRRGARIRVGRELTPELIGYLTARRDQIGYQDLPFSLFPPVGALNDSIGTVGALGVNFVADGRDSLDFPANGYRASLQYENSSRVFGGDLPFSQVEGDWREYISLGKRPKEGAKTENVVPVLAGRLLSGYSRGNVPLQEQFYLGGYELLRGYDLFAFSGQNLLLATVELRFPFGPGLQAVTFTDYGGVWEPSPRKLRASVGAGLRFATPIGPIRLDAAYGSSLQTYISLGQSF